MTNTLERLKKAYECNCQELRVVAEMDNEQMMECVKCGKTEWRKKDAE